MEKVKYLGIVMALVLFFASCLQTAPSTPPPAPAATVAAPAKPAWEERWNTTIVEARKEGKVVVTTRFPSEVRTALSEAFKAKYGVGVEFMAGQIVEIWPKVLAERRAGLYTKDVLMDGGAGIIPLLASEDIADPMEPEFVLPEVMDGNVWRDKKLPFMDKEQKVFLFLSRVGPSIVINNDLVKPEELKSWRDILAPKWNKKILMMDPSITGPGNAIITTLGEIMGVDFLKELAKQEPTINRDMRLQVEWVARARHPLGLGFEFAAMEELRRAGSPISHVVPDEGTYFGAATGGMSLLNQAPHPNARRLFVNWFLSKEGQTLLAKTAGEQSRRIDVPAELALDRRFKEGVKYVDADTQYMIGKREEMKKLSKEIFANLYQ